MENNIDENVDVVVIGAGMAGLTAARELSNQGSSVILLEARDRIGGRTWTDHRLGLDLELGGTWVHWLQPHVWTEITRYGLELTRSPKPELGYWLVGDQVHHGTMDDMWSIVGAGTDEIVEAGKKFFPRPFEVEMTDEVRELDKISIDEVLDQHVTDPTARNLAGGLWASNFNGQPGEGAYTQALRWGALGGGYQDLLWDTLVVYKFRKGMRGLAEAILSDSSADLRLSTVVSEVEERSDGVTVTTSDGRRIGASAAVVTIPLAALAGVTFNPALPEAVQTVSEQNHAGRGMKCWALVRGEMQPFQAMAGAEHPLVTVLFEKTVEGNSLLVGFGPDGNAFDPDDVDAVRDVLRAWFPDIEVLAATGHNWAGDTFSRATYAMLKPGQLSSLLPAVEAQEGRVLLAGADYANGWGGFVDGAISSGIAAPRRLRKWLKSSRP